MKSRRNRVLVVVVGLLLVCFPRLSVAQEEGVIEEPVDDIPIVVDDDDVLVVEDSVPDEIAVDDYLVTLSTEELQKICWERGFALEEPDDDSLTHDDYVEAARRCLSLEEEMNAVLNEHPELAAEIETEIQRLKGQKERLEAERDAMLQEKELLEAQLAQAGVDLDNFRNSSNAATTRKDPADMNFPELLVESFRQLYERVKKDVEFVVRVTQPVWTRVGQAARVGWRHCKPAVLQLWRYSKPLVMQAYDQVRKRVGQVLPAAGASPKEVAA